MDPTWRYLGNAQVWLKGYKVTNSVLIDLEGEGKGAKKSVSYNIEGKRYSEYDLVFVRRRGNDDYFEIRTPGSNTKVNQFKVVGGVEELAESEELDFKSIEVCLNENDWTAAWPLVKIPGLQGGKHNRTRKTKRNTKRNTRNRKSRSRF